MCRLLTLTISVVDMRIKYCFYRPFFFALLTTNILTSVFVVLSLCVAVASSVMLPHLHWPQAFCKKGYSLAATMKLLRCISVARSFFFMHIHFISDFALANILLCCCSDGYFSCNHKCAQNNKHINIDTHIVRVQRHP